MSFAEVVWIATAVSMDSLAVAVAVSLSHYERPLARAARLALYFGGAQASTMAAGLLVGRQIRGVARLAPLATCALFGWVGARMITSAARGDGQGEKDPAQAPSLLMLALGTSLDGFAIGMPVGSLRVSFSPLVPVTGVVVAIFALLGSLLAAHVGRSWGRRAEFAGGVALCFMGAKILLVR